MKFLYQRFKARRGQKVQVDFTKPTKVKLLGSRDFDMYRKCRTNTYVGGQYEDSPAIFNIPNDGEWVAVIEKGPDAAPINVEGKVTLLGDDSELQVTHAIDAPKASALEDSSALGLENVEDSEKTDAIDSTEI